MEIRYAKSASKHGVVEIDIEKIIHEAEFFALSLSRDGRKKLGWIGETYSRELVEIIAVIYETHYFVIHAMQIRKRKGNLNDIKSRLW